MLKHGQGPGGSLHLDLICFLVLCDPVEGLLLRILKCAFSIDTLSIMRPGSVLSFL